MRTESKLVQLLSRFFTITETISQLLQLGVLRFFFLSLGSFLDGPLTMMIYMCVCVKEPIFIVFTISIRDKNTLLLTRYN